MTRNGIAKRQIYIIMTSALVLFLVTTFILVGMLPSPSSSSGHIDSMLAASGAVDHPATTTTTTTNTARLNSPPLRSPGHSTGRSTTKKTTRTGYTMYYDAKAKVKKRSKKSQWKKFDQLRHDYEREVIEKLSRFKKEAVDRKRNHDDTEDTTTDSEIRNDATSAGMVRKKNPSLKSKFKTIVDSQYAALRSTQTFIKQNESTTQKVSASRTKSDHEEGKNNNNNENAHEQEQPAAPPPSDDDDDTTIEEDRSNSNDEPHHPPRLIHILETRFMQNQPNLVQLAEARLHLLSAICLPSVLHQSAWGKFLWVIRTDPNLNEEIKAELASMLEEYGALVQTDESGEERALTYVIGSNDNYVVSNSTTLSPSVRPFDVLGMLSHALSKPTSIFAGKAASMQILHDEISSQTDVEDIFLWTRLDADDGLNIKYMEYIQSQAIRYFLPERYDREIMMEIPEGRLKSNPLGVTKKENPKEDEESQKLFHNSYTPPQWTYWCAALNIDWFLTDPVHDPQHKNGTVYPVIHANVCITPGVTVALRGAFDPLQVPRLDHDKIISHLRRPEGGKSCGRTGLSIFDPEDMGEGEKEDEDDGTCFHMVTLGISAVRSRTPTSAGMLGVNPDATQMEIVKKKPKITAFMWHSMWKNYRIRNEDLVGTNAYFAEHVYDIAEENARGQCTKGHSCKSSSKDLLQQYVDLKSEMNGGFDIIEMTNTANSITKEVVVAADDIDTTTTEEMEEEYEPRLIHILETRFMQHQPNLIQLAKARLHLLSTICLPSVLHQSAWGKFLWVIRTDPELDNEIKKELVSMLDEHGALVRKDENGEESALTYVIGSNDNYVVSNSTTLSPSIRPFDVLGMLSHALSKPHSIFAGKAESMQMLYDEISSRKIVKDVFIWTRLDADDGLNVAYMEYIQSQAIRYFLPDRYEMEIMTEIPENSKGAMEKGRPKEAKNGTLVKSDGVEENQKWTKNTYTPPQWTYWCAQLNIDWFLTDPIHDPHHKNGTVYPVMHSNVCVSPGVTVALRGAFDPLQVPRLDHDKIVSYLKPKGGDLCGRTGLSVFDPHEMGKDEKEPEDDGSCFHMATGGISAVRSRTPTSAGMMGLHPDANQMGSVRLKPKLTPYMWHSMKKNFHISNKELLGTNAYFADHIYDIAEENARGQCTNGHSCKSTSKDLLQQYVDLKVEMDGGFDVTDSITADKNRAVE